MEEPKTIAREVRWPLTAGAILAVIGAVLLIGFSLSPAFNDWSFKINPTLADNFGGFIGGVVGPIFALAAFFMLYKTIADQKATTILQQQTFVLQQQSFLIQQFENRYFEALKFHRDNVEQMTHRLPNRKNTVSKGANVFVDIRRQFSELYQFVNQSAKENGQMKHISGIDRINIAYLILFYGVGKASRSYLQIALKKYNCNEALAQRVISALYKKKTIYSNNTVRYGGHKVRLGHYFRHLFQTVRYISEQDYLDCEQKKSYVKMLRAQLSDFELEVFFFNAFSLGQKWQQNGYITTYELLKNLPDTIGGISKQLLQTIPSNPQP